MEQIKQDAFRKVTVISAVFSEICFIFVSKEQCRRLLIFPLCKKQNILARFEPISHMFNHRFMATTPQNAK